MFLICAIRSSSRRGDGEEVMCIASSGIDSFCTYSSSLLRGLLQMQVDKPLL